MDIIAHGLFGGFFFGKRNKQFLIAALFGMIPDLVSFGLFFVLRLVSGTVQMGKPDISTLPLWVRDVYNISHSMVVWLIVFGLIWIFARRFALASCAWAFHILCDIPTHTRAFFGTVFLYPLSDYQFNGISWGTPWIFWSYWAVLLGLFAWWWFQVSQNNKKGK